MIHASPMLAVQMVMLLLEVPMLTQTFWYEFEETVEHIKVNYWNKQKTSMLIISLPHAIDILVTDGWTTPQVVEWLRSHEND